MTFEVHYSIHNPLKHPLSFYLPTLNASFSVPFGDYNTRRRGLVHYAYSNDIIRLSYLRNAGDHAEQPGDGQHQLAASVGVVQVDRVSDGEVTIQADGGEDERGQVEAERTEEHQDATRDVAGVPRHRHVPADLQRHHHESHQEIGYGQVHDEEVDARPAVTVTEERDEDGEVTEARDEEQHRVGDHRHQTLVVEDHLAWQAQRRLADDGRDVDRPIEGHVVEVGVLGEYGRLRGQMQDDSYGNVVTT